MAVRDTILIAALLKELREMAAAPSSTNRFCGLVADAMMVDVSSGVPSTPVQWIG